MRLQLAELLEIGAQRFLAPQAEQRFADRKCRLAVAEYAAVSEEFPLCAEG